MTRKSSVAQSEILIGLLFLTLFSGAVIAQNATNITNFTGNFIGNITEPETPTFTVEATKTYEVWANSAIAFPLTKTTFYNNETLELRISLLLDNGTFLSDEPIEFFLGGNLIGSNLTDPSGETTFSYSLKNQLGEKTLSVVYNGGEFVNPSQEDVQIRIIQSNASELIKTRMNLVLENDTIFELRQTEIDAELLLDDGTGLEGATVEIYADNELIATETTDSVGWISVSWQLPNITEEMELEIRAVFPGDGVYAVSENISMLTVIPLNITIPTHPDFILQRGRGMITQIKKPTSEVISGQPIQWTQTVFAWNVFDQPMEGFYISLDELELPKEYSSLGGTESNGKPFEINDTAINFPTVQPGESYNITLRYQTPAVEIEVQEQEINLLDMIPDEASDIEVVEKTQEGEQEFTGNLNDISWKKRNIVVTDQSDNSYNNLKLKLKDLEEGVKKQFLEEGSEEKKLDFNTKEYKGKLDLIFDIEHEEETQLTLESEINEKNLPSRVGELVEWVIDSHERTVTFKTPAPTKKESLLAANKWIKQVVINSNLHSKHVKDTLVTSSIPETLNSDAEISLLTEERDFGIDENPEFKIKVDGGIRLLWTGSPNGPKDVTLDKNHSVRFFDTNGNGINDTIEWIVPQLSEQEYMIEEGGIQVYAEDGKGESHPVQIEETSQGEYTISLEKGRKYRAGTYKLIIESGPTREEIWFQWGLITVNTRKAMYHPGERAEIVMVVLDKQGYLVRSADVELEITDPRGRVTVLSTGTGDIRHPSKGVYETVYTPEHEGTYTMTARASYPGVDAIITSAFEARDFYEFDIIRDIPVTIYPVDGPFQANITIKPFITTDSYSFTEYLPSEFFASASSAVISKSDEISMTWNNLSGETKISYTFNAPNLWPYMYAMGPGEIQYEDQIFQEARSWLLAVDPPAYWWNDTFARRKAVNISENSGNTLTEYQILIELNTIELIDAGYMQSNCEDIRIANLTDPIPYYVEDYSCYKNNTYVWAQVPQINSSVNNTIYIYYDPYYTVSTTGDEEEVFNYSVPYAAYYPVGDANAGGGVVVAFRDNTNVTVGASSWSLDQGDTQEISPGSNADPVLADKPIHVVDTQSAQPGDSYVPVSWASDEFLYEWYRTDCDPGDNTRIFILSPWQSGYCTFYQKNADPDFGFNWGSPWANISFTAGTATDTYTGSPSSANCWPQDVAVYFNCTSPVLAFAEGRPIGTEQDHCPLHKPESQNLYGFGSNAFDLAARYSGTRIRNYYSDGETILTVFMEEAQGLQISASWGIIPIDGPMDPTGTSCASSQCGRYCDIAATNIIVDGTLGYDYVVGAMQSADSDGNENTVFMPDYDLGREYFFAETSNYLAIAAIDPYTNCTVYDTSGDMVYWAAQSRWLSNISDGHEYPYPGKIYLSAANQGDVLAGYQLLCNGTVFVVTERDDGDDEFNIMSMKGMRKIQTPEPTYYIYDEESIVPRLNNTYAINSTGGTKAGWGEGINFTVSIWEPENQSLDMYFWYSNITTGGWWLWNISNASGFEVSGNHTIDDIKFNCTYLLGNYSSFPANLNFKFNTTDPSGHFNETSTNTFIIEEDDLNIDNIFPLDNAVINRTNTTEFIIRLYDTDNQSYPASSTGLVYLTEDDIATWDSGDSDGVINSSGHLVRTVGHVDWNCSTTYPLGPRKFRGDTNHTCYFSNQTTGWDFTLYGTMNDTNFNHPNGSENYTRGNNIILNFSTYDDCGDEVLSFNDAYFNLTSQETQQSFLCSLVEHSINNFHYCTWDTTGKPIGLYNVTFHAEKQYYNNVSGDSTFYLLTPPHLNYPSVTPSSGGWGIKPYNYSINVTDDPGEEVNVSIYFKKEITGGWIYYDSTTCTDCNNTMVSFTRNFSCSDIGYWYFLFNATDEKGNNNLTNGADVHYVNKSLIAIEYISGNESYATPFVPAEFILRAYGLENQSYVFPGVAASRPLIYFNVTTTEGDWGSRKYVNDTRTDEDGYANVTFAPDITFNSGNQTWFGYVYETDQCYIYNISENLTVEVDVNWHPLYRNMMVNGETTTSNTWEGGWNFSVEVKDYGTEGQDLNVTLQIDTGSGWIDYGSQDCLTCLTWEWVNFTNVLLTCADINSSARFRFNVTDNVGNENGTETYTAFSVDRDNVTFDILAGHGTNVIANRTAALENLTLQVRISDENGTYLPTFNTTLYITQLGQIGGSVLWDSGEVVYTNTTGHVTLNFTASDHCDNESTPYDEEEYEVGPHWWYLGVNPSEACYKLTTSVAMPSENDYYNFTTIGQLNNTIVNPSSEGIIQQGRSNITATSYIYNYCQEPMQIDTNNVTFNFSTAAASYLCTPIQIVGENVYTCNWDTINRTDGDYNFTMISYADNYYNDTDLEEDAFTLKTIPLLEEANATDRSESWSVPRNFSVKVTDNLGDTVNVTLVIAVGTTEVDYQTLCCGPSCPANPDNCSETLLYWNDTYLNNLYECTSYAEKTAKVWVRAEDYEAYEYETSVPTGDYIDDDETIYIEKADIRIDYISGNESIATPSQSAAFSLRVYDLDNETYIYTQSESTRPSVYFNVTTTEGDWLSRKYVNNTRADGTGYANVTFTPDITFNSGNQTWLGYIPSSDLCYEQNTSENLTVDVDVNWAPLYRNMLVNGETTSGMQWGEGGFNFSVEVKDFGTEGQDLNVTLQIDTGSGWTDYESQDCLTCLTWEWINFSYINLTCADINSSAQFRFNVTDDINNENGTNTYSIFSVYRNNVTFEILDGHGTSAIANRTSDATNLTMQLRVRDENGTYLSGFNTTLYISQLGSLGGSVLWDSGEVVYTNASGHITLNFTAADHCDNESTPYVEEEYEVGPHWWYVEVNSNEQCHKLIDSTSMPDQNDYYNFTTVGQLNNTIVTPTGGTIIQQGRANVSITSYIYNYCQEPMQIDTSNVTFNFSTAGAAYLCTPIQIVGENVYTCDWDTLNRTDGDYNFTMISHADNYYNDTDLEEDAFTLRTIPMLKEVNATDRSESWSSPRNFSVKVTDNLGDTVNVTLVIAVGASEVNYETKCCGPACPSNPNNCSETLLYWNDTYLNDSYDCSNYAEKTAKFWFDAIDYEAYAYETSVPAGDYVGDDDTIYFEKAETRIDYIAGNNTQTTPATSTDFSLRVYDLDNQTFDHSSQPSSTRPLVYFNVTTTEGDWLSRKYVNDTRTSATGYANVSFLPDVTFNSGNQTWLGYIHQSDLCYEYNTSENLTVDVEVNWPGLYRNMTVNWMSTDNKGWGGYWNFSVEVKDFGSEGGDLNITLQIDSGSGWADISSQDCLSCSSWDQINFTNLRMSCSDINSSARFRFNITDDGGNENGTDTYSTFGILRDNIQVIHIQGNDSTANRSSNQIDTFIMRYFDTDNQTYLPQDINVTLWVTWNYYAYDDGHLLQTNDTGYISYDFDPGCSSPEYEVGLQRWYTKINTSESCYFSNESDIYNVTVMGDFNITVFKPDGSNNYTWGDSIFMQGQVRDDCSNTIDYANVTFNMTVNTYQYLLTPSGLGGGFYQGDWDSTNASEGYYNVTMQVNKTNYYDNESVVIPPDSFYLFTIPLLKEANATPRTDGWGATYNFTVNVTDEYGDNVTVILETKRYGFDYSQVQSSQNCTSCDNVTMEWNETYTCDAISGNPTRNFRFTGTDDKLNERKTSTSAGDYVSNDDTYVLEKNDVDIFLYSGQGNTVNRSSGNTTLILIVNDTDREIYAQDSEATVYLNVSTNTTNPGSVNRTEDNNQTNGTGYVHLTFSPNGNCSYHVGNQTWYGYTDSADTCYKNFTSPSYNVTIIGDMDAGVVADQYIYHQEDNVNITINITDECGNDLVNVNVTAITVKNSTANFTCGDIIDYGNGTFRCNWTTSQATPIAKYNVEVNITTNGFYNNDTEMHYDVFWLQSYVNNAPQFLSPDYTPEGWGAPMNFTVNIRDDDYNNVSVNFYTGPTSSGPWTLKENQLCEECNNHWVNFSLYHDCSDVGTEFWFKFNGTDQNYTGQWDLSGTSTNENYTVQKDNVTFTVIDGTGSIVNRSGSQTVQPMIVVSVYDSDNQTYVGQDINGSLWVTYNEADYWVNLDNVTNGSSNLHFAFDPDCNYSAAEQDWKVGVSDNTCYSNQNMTTASNLTVMGDMRQLVVEANCSGNNTCYHNENVTVIVNITDECSGYIDDANLGINLSHDSYQLNCTPVNNNGSGTYNCTLNVTTSPGGNYNITVDSNQTYHNQNITIHLNPFFVEVAPIVNLEWVNPSSAYWARSYAAGPVFTFYVNVTDDDDDVTVQLWHYDNETGPPYTLANSTVLNDAVAYNTTLSYAYTTVPSDIGYWNWKINISDNNGMSDETTVHELEVLKRPVNMSLIYGNDTDVNRIGTNVTVLGVLVKDDYDQFNIAPPTGRRFWVTTDGTNYGDALTPSPFGSGYMNHSFDPDCNYNVGLQKWKAGIWGESRYDDTNSSEFELEIFSDLFSSVIYPDGQSWDQGQNVPISGNVSDECGQVTAATVRIKSTDQFGVDLAMCIPDPATDMGGGVYNCSQSTSGGDFGLNSWYNVSMNSSKTYYNVSNIIAEDKFRVAQEPDLTNPQVTPFGDGWGVNFTFTVTVNDQDLSDVVNISF